MKVFYVIIREPGSSSLRLSPSHPIPWDGKVHNGYCTSIELLAPFGHVYVFTQDRTGARVPAPSSVTAYKLTFSRPRSFASFRRFFSKFFSLSHHSHFGGQIFCPVTSQAKFDQNWLELVDSPYRL